MQFNFPPRVHVLRNIKRHDLLLGFQCKNNSYLLGLLRDRDAIYITRMITDNVTGTIDNFTPIYPDEKFDMDRSVLLLHDKIKLTITKEDSSQYDWIIESMDTYKLLTYPRQKYIGLIMPIEQTNETPNILEYNSIMIEPILDPGTFNIDIVEK